jgi:hypothetical protein
MRETRPLLVALDAAARAALAGAPGGHQVRTFGGRSWKAELVSAWGWPDADLPAKVAKAREIADLLEAEGLVCAFDVLQTGGLDVVFELT